MSAIIHSRDPTARRGISGRDFRAGFPRSDSDRTKCLVKLRRLPEDFRVEELTSVRGDGGAFALYRLCKRSIGTPEVIHAIVDRWRVPRQRISYGGLKDRHAVTVQYLTIHRGPKQGLTQKSFEVEYLGQTSEPFTSAAIDRNRFILVLRDLSEAETAAAIGQVPEISAVGLPNYFDDQRFGSFGKSGEWIGRAWCLGDYERALWLALADPHPDDSSDEKRQKQLLQSGWGHWPECKRELARSHRRSIVTYLSDKIQAGRPADFRGAFARISVDLRGLYLSAYQSALWNRLLSRCFEYEAARQAGGVARISFPLISGPCTCLTGLTDDQAAVLQSLQLPLPSARIDRPEGIVGELLDEVLREEQIELRQLRVKYPRDSFFSRGTRAAIVPPANLSAVADADDLHPGRRLLTLSFDLPRGSYATILVKRLTCGPVPATPHDRK